MGVTGLWRLIEPAGKPVPVETLENKVLAVDISIWLHQMVKGYQDAKGAPLPNAHLMGLFQRLCKLLYFRIKPVFVFDGVFPELKKETIAKRQDHKAKYNSESERIKRELALLLSKKTAIKSLLGTQISPKTLSQTKQISNSDDLFKLPALPQIDEDSESESEDDTSNSSIDLHTVDIESETFKNLPVKEKYDILLDLKETRKQNSWGKLQELPKKSDNFSDFQMQRLLKRRKVQECLEETEKEMGDCGMSLHDLECLLNEEGIDTKIETLPTRRIASDVTSRFLLIKDIKKALSDAKSKQDKEEIVPGSSTVECKESEIIENKTQKVDELEDDLQKAIKMSLECIDEPNNGIVNKSTDDSWTSCMTDSGSDYVGSDSEEEDGFEHTDLSCAKAYIMQYSDFTHKAIDEIVTKKVKRIPKMRNIDSILEEINKEKSIIVDNVDISSSDDDSIQEYKDSENSYSNNVPNIGLNSVPISQKVDDSLSTTQASVVYVENPTQEIIDLNSSTEYAVEPSSEIENVEVKNEFDSSENEVEELVSNTENIQDTDSSDGEFEEVIDTDTESKKPVVELILKMNTAPDDDIFADLFTNDEKTTSKKVENILSENKKPNPEIPIDTSSKNLNMPEEITSKVQIDVTNAADKFTNNEVKIVRIDNETREVSDTPEIEAPAIDLVVTTTTSKIITQEVNNTYKNLKPVDITKNPPEGIINTERLNYMVEEMQNQEQELIQEKGRLDRVGRNITEQMTKEAQELLQIFGIPYIVAPMEAEAQCAFLESAKLTDGTITDDSDIWLFGGRTVYKNFFNQKKHVLQFQAERIESSFNLNREQLILLALLVGSDYTTGLTGVGPVTAMEILASFPINKRQLLNETTKPGMHAYMIKGLQEFKQWVKAGKRTDNNSLKKKLKNVVLTEDFPSLRVVQAYLDPNVEKSEDKFTWGQLDVTILRDYTKTKFGWSQNKLDEIVKPVLKRVSERITQRSMQDFFKRKIDFQSLEDQMSKRVKAAVQKMGPEAAISSVEDKIENTEKKPKPGVKRKTSNIESKAGPSARKQKKSNETNMLLKQGVKVVSLEDEDGKPMLEIKINKTDRFQEIIPQREKDKAGLLENKLKAIEVFRKTKLDKKKKTFKRKALKPKDKADLSESDSD